MIHDNPAVRLPVLFKHCPVPRKPGRHASEKRWRNTKSSRNCTVCTARTADQNKELQERVAEDRNIVFIGGGYSNRTIIDAVIQDYCHIGRIRKILIFLPFRKHRITAKGESVITARRYLLRMSSGKTIPNGGKSSLPPAMANTHSKSNPSCRSAPKSPAAKTSKF